MEASIGCRPMSVCVLVCECKWPQVAKCHLDRDQKKKFVPVSMSPPLHLPRLRLDCGGECKWDVARVKHTRRGHSWNGFLGDEDFNSKRRLWWSGRGSRWEGPSTTQHQTSYTWVTRMFLTHPTYINPHLFPPPTTQITASAHTLPMSH